MAVLKLPVADLTRLAARLRPLAPLLLLLLALATLFVFDGGRDHFYRYPGDNDSWNSSMRLTVADNLSPAHRFRLFLQLYPAEDGAVDYQFYSRFPVGGSALMKLATLPFGDDLSARIFAARMLMLLLFGAAVALAWRALWRITGSRWIALTATLLAFSANYMLYISDIISNERSMDTFALLLVFHGMVVFEQEGRFRQLLIKSGIALLLGWHIYGLLLPFIVIGLARELFRAVKSSSAPGPDGAGPSAGAGWGRLLFRSRYLRLGVAALLFGLAVLGFNFATEYTAFDGETAITELPNYESLLRRIGGNEGFNESNAELLAWPKFLERQFFFAGAISLSRALPGYTEGFVTPGMAQQFRSWIFAAGIFALIAALAGLLFTRHRLLLATLALSGFCWALPMRHNTGLNNGEAAIYFGLPLVLFAVALLGVRRYAGDRWGPRLLAALGVAAAAVFALSSFQMSRVEQQPETSAFRRAAMADFETMRPVTRGKSVFIDWPQQMEWPPPVESHLALGRHAILLYLVGSRITNPYFLLDDGRPLKTGDLDFVISPEHHQGVTLTPDNRVAFLYHSADYLNLYRPSMSGEPAAGAFFDVHLHDDPQPGDALLYAKAPCGPAEVREWFFLHLYPADAGDLPEARQPYGYGNQDFRFERHGAIFDGVCFARVPLPEYRLKSIKTGQFERGRGRSWEVEFSVPQSPDSGAARPAP